MTRFLLITALTLPLLAGQVFLAADAALAQDTLPEMDSAVAEQENEAAEEADTAQAEHSPASEPKGDAEDRLSFGGDLSELATDLRNEVKARKKAGDSWGNAMLTLVKAQSDGIETMDMSVVTQADRQTEEPAIASSSDSGTSCNLCLIRVGESSEGVLSAWQHSFFVSTKSFAPSHLTANGMKIMAQVN